MYAVVSAFRCADRPWGARIGRPRRQCVVRAFTKRCADRMDRRQVNHVEAHRGRRFQAFVRGVERAGDPLLVYLIPRRSLGAREELIPRREQRLTTIGEDRIVWRLRDPLAWTEELHCLAYVVG